MLKKYDKRPHNSTKRSNISIGSKGFAQYVFVETVRFS